MRRLASWVTDHQGGVESAAEGSTEVPGGPDGTRKRRCGQSAIEAVRDVEKMAVETTQQIKFLEQYAAQTGCRVLGPP